VGCRWYILSAEERGEKMRRNEKGGDVNGTVERGASVFR